MLTILYFASLRETVGKASESRGLPANPTVAGLVAELRSRSDAWAAALDAGKRWRVAVNQEMASLDTPLRAGDEVAIFPPVTGG